MNSAITFKKNREHNYHYRRLKKLLNAVVADLPTERKNNKVYMVCALPFLFIFIYVTAMYFNENTVLYYSMYALLGVLSVIIFVNIIHDAVHNNIFKSKRLNELFLLFFDLIGGNSFIWKKRHMLMHHNFQNIAGWDSDIEQSGLIKIYPHEKTGFIQRHQHIFIFVFYPLYLFNWILVRDFKDFFGNNRLINKVVRIPKIEYVKLFLFKIIFLTYILIVPIIFGAEPVVALGALCIMFVVGSIFAMISLLTPHVNETNQFPLPDAEGKMTVSWFEHQFITTNDINLNNWFTRNFMGNFNFHIVHHLFPNINSVYAPEVTRVIKDYAEENNIEYRSYGLFEALKYHYRLIKSNAIDFNVFEEDM